MGRREYVTEVFPEGGHSTRRPHGSRHKQQRYAEKDAGYNSTVPFPYKTAYRHAEEYGCQQEWKDKQAQVSQPSDMGQTEYYRNKHQIDCY